MSIMVVINALIVYGFAFLPDTSLTVWTITDNLAVKFQQDGLSRFFSCLIASVWALVVHFTRLNISSTKAQKNGIWRFIP